MSITSPRKISGCPRTRRAVSRVWRLSIILSALLLTACGAQPATPTTSTVQPSSASAAPAASPTHEHTEPSAAATSQSQGSTTSSGDIAALATSVADTLNNKNADAFAALFADTAVIDDVGIKIEGKDAIKRWAENLMSSNIRLEIDSTEVDNNTLIWFHRYALGGRPPTTKARVVTTVENGLITSLTIRAA